MKKQNWDDIEERQDGAGFDRPTPGAYIARICNVEDVEKKEYLRIEWDFSEGQFEGYNEETFDRAGFWPTILIRSYKPKALGFFKGFKTALEESNRGYRFDEAHLERMVGKGFGVVLGEEEYQKKDGTVGTRLYVAQTRSIRAIEKGDFEVPKLKKLSGSAAPAPQTQWTQLPDDDGDIPF